MEKKIKEVKVQKSFRLKESTLKMLNRIQGKDDTERVEYCINKTFNFMFKEEIKYPFSIELKGYQIINENNLLSNSIEELKKLNLKNEIVRNMIKDFSLINSLIFNVQSKSIGFDLSNEFGLDVKKNTQRLISEFQKYEVVLGIDEETALKLMNEHNLFRDTKKETIYHYDVLSEEYLKIEKTETDTLVFTPDKDKIIDLIVNSEIVNGELIKDMEYYERKEKIELINSLKIKVEEMEVKLEQEEREQYKQYSDECIDYLHLLNINCNNKENRIAYLLENIKDNDVIEKIGKEYFSYYRIKELLGDKQIYALDSPTYFGIERKFHNASDLNISELKAYNEMTSIIKDDATLNQFYSYEVVSNLKEVTTINFNDYDYDKTESKRWFNVNDKYFIIIPKKENGEFIIILRLSTYFLKDEK